MEFDGDAIVEGIYMADDSGPEPDVTDEKDVEQSTDVESEDDQEAVVDEKEPEPEQEQENEFEKRFKDIESRLNQRESHISDLNKAIHGLRQENKALKNKAPEDGEPVFTDAQILNIMQEHKDDPAVLFQAMKEVVRQGAKDISKVSDKKIEFSQKQQAVAPALETWKPYLEANPQWRDAMEKAKEFHYLDDNPTSDYLALGAVLVSQWPQIVKEIREGAKKEFETGGGLADKAEDARKKTIKNSKPAPSKGDGARSESVPKEWIETANTLGLTDKKQRQRYFDMMRKSSKQ